MTLTITKLGKIIASNLRTLADTGDWRTAARSAADALDPQQVPTPPPAPSGPLGGTGKYSLVWSDHFSAPALDLTHWRTGRPADAAGGHSGYAANEGEKSFYLGEHVSIRNGQLVLTATNEPLNVVLDHAHQGLYVPKGSKLPDGSIAGVATCFSPQEQGTWQYPSGTVTTGPDRNGWLSAIATGGKTWTPLPAGVSSTYGFWEVRAKLPAAGPGLWPAIWLVPVDGSWSFEIDSMECVDPTGHCIAQHLHANNGAIDFTANPGQGLDMGKDMTADFHTYSIDWEAGSLKWLIDGQVTQQTTVNVPNVPMYLIMNLAVGGNWPGDPAATTKFPAEMIVDYVRLWQR